MNIRNLTIIAQPRPGYLERDDIGSLLIISIMIIGHRKHQPNPRKS